MYKFNGYYLLVMMWYDKIGGYFVYFNLVYSDVLYGVLKRLFCSIGMKIK